jgi:hypothetical protein
VYSSWWVSDEFLEAQSKMASGVKIEEAMER